MISRVDNPHDRAFLEEQVEIRLAQIDRCLAACTDDLKSYVVLGFQHYNGHDMELSIATNGGRTWATREFLRTAFSYVFDDCGCHRCTVRVREDNTQSLELVKRLGWKQEGVLREAVKTGENLIIFGMLRQECRWISDGRKQQERRGHPACRSRAVA